MATNPSNPTPTAYVTVDGAAKLVDQRLAERDKVIAEMEAIKTQKATATAWLIANTPKLDPKTNKYIIDANTPIRSAYEDAIPGMDTDLAALEKRLETHTAAVNQALDFLAAINSKTPQNKSSEDIAAQAAGAAQNLASASLAYAQAEKIRDEIARLNDPNSTQSQLLQAQLEHALFQRDGAQYQAQASLKWAGLTDRLQRGEITMDQFTQEAAGHASNFGEWLKNREATQKEENDKKQLELQGKVADNTKMFNEATLKYKEAELDLQRQNAATAQENAAADRALRERTLNLQETEAQKTRDFQEKQYAESQRQAQMAAAAKVNELATQRQAAANQATTSYEQYGVATPDRIQSLADMRKPLGAEQVAAMVGLDPKSPEFQKLYGMYNMALGGKPPEQTAQPAAQPPAAAGAPPPTVPSPMNMPSISTTQVPYFQQGLGALQSAVPNLPPISTATVPQLNPSVPVQPSPFARGMMPNI